MQPRITYAEASALIRQLEPRCEPPSYWQLRDLDLLLGVVDPACVVVNDRVRNRLLDPLDVMLLRLWTRISNTTMQPGWVAGAVLSRHRDVLRRALKRRQAVMLVLRGLRSALVSVDDAAPLDGEQYLLADLSAGVVEAMRAIRQQQPLVWNGSRKARPSELSTVPSSQAAQVCEVSV